MYLDGTTLLSILCWGAVSLLTTHAQNMEVCQYTEEEFDGKFQTILDYFEDTKHSRQHMVFIFDRSRSVTDLNRVKLEQSETVKSILDYLIANGLIFITETYLRISVITVGSTNLVVNQAAGTACKATKGIEDGLSRAGSGQTLLTNALLTALAIFQAEEKGKKVMWVFYDGDSNESDNKYRQNLTNTVDALRGAGVVTFAVGIGEGDLGYMRTVENELRVQELASDLDHYVCAKDLKPRLEAAQETREAQEDEALNVFQDCELYDSCVSGSLQLPCDETFDPVNCTGVTIPPDNRDCSISIHRQIWFIVIMTLVGIIAVFALVFFIVLCICYNLRNCFAPPRPPPRIVGRSFTARLAPSSPESDELYTNTSPLNGHVNTGFDSVTYMDNKPVCNTGQSYGESYMPGESISPYSGTTQYSGGKPGMYAGSPLQMTPSIYTKTRDLPEKPHLNYLNDVIEETTVNMPGWDTYVKSVAEDFGLRHLGFFERVGGLKMNYTEAAWTPGFRLSTKEIKELGKCIKNGVHKYKGGDFKVASETYRLTNSNEESHMELKAIRTNTPEGRIQDYLVAVKSGKFIVVGVGLNADFVYEAVVQVHRNLEQSLEDDGEVIYERMDHIPRI